MDTPTVPTGRISHGVSDIYGDTSSHLVERFDRAPVTEIRALDPVPSAGRISPSRLAGSTP